MSAQILNVAYISEKSGEKLYENLVAFGEIFEQIFAIRKNGLNLLQNCAELSKYKFDEVALEQNLQMQNLNTTNEFEALVFALNYELSLNKTYESLCDVCENEQIKDVLFRLWATSNNEYIPALKAQLIQNLTQKQSQKNEQNFGIDFLNSYQENFSAMSEQIKEIISGKADKEQLSKLVENPNFPFFSGLAIGALGSQIINKNLKEK